METGQFMKRKKHFWLKCRTHFRQKIGNWGSNSTD